MTNQKEFTKMNTGTFDTDNGTRVWYSTMIDQADYVGKEQGEYGEEIIYKAKAYMPGEDNQSAVEKEIELRINENKRALGKVIVDGKENVIWKFNNDDGIATIFKYNDGLWVKVKKKKNVKTDEIYYTIGFSYIDDDMGDNGDDLEEVDF